jgi:hypothetical protein
LREQNLKSCQIACFAKFEGGTNTEMGQRLTSVYLSFKISEEGGQASEAFGFGFYVDVQNIRGCSLSISFLPVLE